MLGALGGAIIFGLAGASLWLVMPTNGKMHRLTTIPGMETLLVFAVITGLTVGAALFISGLPVWK